MKLFTCLLRKNALGIRGKSHKILLVNFCHSKNTDKVKKIKLSEYLSKKRTLSGLTQSDVSKVLGYSTPQFISNWERGLSAPPLDVLKKVAKLYNVPASEIFEILLRESMEQMEKNLVQQFYGTGKRST